MGASWKTTSAGIASILAVAASIFQHGGLNGVDWNTAIPALISGVGLLFAKDHDVTGGTKQQ